VYVIRTSDGSVRKAFEELRNPHGVSFTPDGQHAWVTDPERDQVVVLAASSLRTVGRIGVGRTPWNTAFTADSATAYVTNANDDTVTVIDAATRRVTTTIALGGSNGQLHHQPTAIGLSPAGNIWATCNSSSSLAVIDTSSNTVIASIDLGLGDDPTGIAFA
jgi:phospholipase C